MRIRVFPSVVIPSATRNLLSAASGYLRPLLRNSWPLALAALLAVAVLGGCEKKPEPRPLTIESYTAGEQGGYASAHLLMGETEAMLVDAAMTRADAEAILEMVRRSGKTLKYIFLTHAHPDHVLGGEVVHLAFRDARVIASPAVASHLSRTGHIMLNAMKKRYGDDIPDSFIVPRAHDEPTIELEGRTLQVLRMGSGESRSAAALYIPDNQALVTGDAIYHQVHLWLVDLLFEQWRLNIASLRDAGPVKAVYPGHGEPGGPEMLDENLTYLNTFEQEAKQADGPEALKAAMVETFPDYRMERYLDNSIQAQFPASRR